VIRVERRAYVPTSLVIAGSIIAAATTLIVTAGILGLMHVSPISLVRVVTLASFGSPAAIADTVAQTGALILIGLAAVLTFRVGLINLGLDGQLITGALAALAISSGALPVPGLAIVPFTIAAGVIAGALSVVLINLLKAQLNIDEAIVTILLNVILLLALQLMTGATITGLPSIGALQALPRANIFDFPEWAQTLRYLGPLAAIFICLLTFVLLRFTIWGLDIRATGGNVIAADFAGINVPLVRLRVAALSGMLVGLAGAGTVVSTGGGSAPSLTLGLGYAGIAVALLAALEPIGVIPAAIFVAALLKGIKVANQLMGVSLDLANVTIALLLITALLARSAVRHQVRRPSRSEVS
jgi:general nucleoside transport system permease protein